MGLIYGFVRVHTVDIRYQCVVVHYTADDNTVFDVAYSISPVLRCCVGGRSSVGRTATTQYAVCRCDEFEPVVKCIPSLARSTMILHNLIAHLDAD